MNIAIQGEKASFHDQATRLWFGNDAIIIPGNTFADVFDALDNGTADQAVVAIENTLYGSIDQTLDLIEKHRFAITGELFLHIHQQLITLPDVSLSDITQVYSHPVALAQCDNFLSQHLPKAKRIEYHDTAASVRFIKNNGDPSVAAIAGAVAASDYSLPILQHNIEDNKANTTRFLVINPKGAVPAHANKSSLSLVTNHSPGALAHVLTLFAQAGANLTKLESRPIVGSSWKYRFHLDVEIAGAPLHAIIAQIRQTGATVTILGEYVSGTTY
jgi:prephenate dehydratase